MTRGTNEGERIGNSIKPLNLNIKGYLLYTPSGAAPYSPFQSRIAVRMIVCQPKQFSNNTNATSSTWLGNLLEKGNTTTFYTGKLSDINAKINNEAITVYSDRTHYMTASIVAQVSAAGYYHIDNSNATKFFNINLKIKKTLHYDDNISSGLYPTNYAPVILIGWSYLDGTAIGSLTDVSCNYDANLTYEDA